MTKIISLINHKGGVGKTTSTANIGASLSQLGKRVLLLDLDAQANLTLHMGLEANQEKTIYGALKGKYPLPIISINKYLDLVPSTLDLSTCEIELSAEAGREYLLKYLITPIKDNYDFILIDCPPSLGLLTLNALSVSNQMIIPMELSKFAIEGMNRLFEVTDKVKVRLNADLQDYKILLTKVDLRKTIQQNIKEVITEKYSNNIFKTFIRTNVALEEAQMKGTDIFTYNSSCNGATDYNNITKEII